MSESLSILEDRRRWAAVAAVPIAALTTPGPTSEADVLGIADRLCGYATGDRPHAPADPESEPVPPAWVASSPPPVGLTAGALGLLRELVVTLGFEQAADADTVAAISELAKMLVSGKTPLIGFDDFILNLNNALLAQKTGIVAP